MLEWRLDAYRRCLTVREPHWARVDYGPIDYQDLYYYSAPRRNVLQSLDEVDPEILRTYEKLGIPLREQEILAGVERPEGSPRVAVDAVFDSVSVATTFQQELAKAGVLFMPISEALRKHPKLVKKYLGTVVPISDNFFATLNSAVFSDGSFVYVPPGVRCPMELSTYFRINEKNTGQFERTLIIADTGAYVSYLEGCTAPKRDENQLHAAVVELIALDDAETNYSTVQNWYPGNAEAHGGIFNFVTKRGDCRGARSKISWTQVETGIRHHLKISELHPPRRLFAGGVLLDRHIQRSSAGRFRHQDDPPRQQYVEPDHLQRHRCGSLQQHLPRPRHQLRLAPDRRPMWCAYRALHRSQERLDVVRARGEHVEDLRGHAVLLPAARPVGGGSHRARRQWFRQGRAAALADGVRGRGAEADRNQPRGERGVMHIDRDFTGRFGL
jgi:SUF system FeS cluster assembly, SufBD/SufBD protein N-terminal region